MPDITIRPVASQQDLEAFIRFPWTVYRGDPNWVPPLVADQRKLLDRAINPFFQHARAQYLLAYRGGGVAGRIAAHVDDNHNAFHAERCGFFGFFESLNDRAVADALLGAAREWIRAQGMDTMRGPFNFTTNDTAGLLIDAFDSPPVIEMTYNPSYYPELLEGWGLAKAMDLYAYFFDVAKMDHQRLAMLGRRVERKGIRFRNMNIRRFEDDVRKFKEIYNQAWAKNWGFIPMTEPEMEHMARNFKAVVDPDFLIFAFDGDRPVGALWALPDYNLVIKKLNGRMGPLEMLKFLLLKGTIRHARVMTAGVVNDYRQRGIEAGLVARVFENGVRKGYTSGELSWVLADNVMMNRLAEAVGARIYKTYRVYEAKV
ncbi:MAG: N-acetyltransferase [Candidatus Edwardsbacteria bacterium]|jgi:hypothetical protein|nr:N-acetyltransferase [Candidatus Edwardsbacteria bacterium]